MPHDRAVISRTVVRQAADDNNATDPPSQLADYYQWVEPDRGIRIYINFETAERLQVHVLQGLDSKGGVEVGGVLLGRKELDEGRIKAVIEDFEPVPCTYSNGPLYSPSGANAARFEAAIERCSSEANSGLSIVGYYRSHKRDDLYLSADDLTLIRRVFSGTENVFLLVKPLSIRACTGGFFLWDEGNIQSEFTLEVPFAPIRPPSSTPDAIDDLLLPDRLDLTMVPQESGTPRWRQARYLVATGVGVVLSLGVFGYWQVRKTGHAPVTQAARQVAQQVAPTVTESGQHPPIPAITRSTAVEKTLPIPSPGKQPTPTAQPGIFHPPRTQQVTQPPVPGTTAAVPDPKLEEAPSLPGVVDTRINELTVAPTAVTPPPQIVSPRVEPVPVTPAQQSPAVPNAEPGPSQGPAKTTFVGPQITYRVNPSIPLDVRTLVTGEAQIDVTVKIDAAGKVVDAQVTSTRGAAARLVAAEAIKAARLCRFQPARENDRAVQSRMVLTFRFRRTGE